jgi:hypothetical protein
MMSEHGAWTSALVDRRDNHVYPDPRMRTNQIALEKQMFNLLPETARAVPYPAHDMAVAHY